MGMHASAKLIYGYRLKADEEGWLVREVHPANSDEYGLNLPWLDNSDDFQSKAEDMLLAAVGFEDTGYDEDPDGWRERYRAAQARVSVEFVNGGYQYSDLFLAATTYTADVGDVVNVTPGGLLVESGATANERLAGAFATLGLTPTQEQPAWLLTACYG